LGFYLNQIPYGSNAYGIEAAAQTYFAKHASELTIAEGALLSALPKAPTYYSPYGSHIEEMTARKNTVIDRMRDLGYITPEEAEEARRQELEFSETRTSINAPHFVFYVREALEDRYGEEYLAKAGLKITTTIDWELQKMAEEIVKKQVIPWIRQLLSSAEEFDSQEDPFWRHAYGIAQGVGQRISSGSSSQPSTTGSQILAWASG